MIRLSSQISLTLCLQIRNVRRSVPQTTKTRSHPDLANVLELQLAFPRRIKRLF